ncbi:MAG: type II secretion system F family protein [Candidatus Riflebacteria bacterium]|nr:type II secretion system F family protein [Candidatus Riflebacteria bacterium]
MRYSYKAIDVNGNEVTGELEAEKTEDVGTWLSDRGYIVVSIAQATLQNIVGNNHKYLSIPHKDMNFFLIQLSNLITAGCPLLMSLNALYRQVSNASLRILLKEVKEKIESGKSFSEALKTHKEVFPSLFITMVEVGEVGGMLGEVLERYSYIYDTMYKLRKKIFQAMIYPGFLLIGTLLVVWVLLVKVFPVFIEGTQRTGNQLPAVTQLVLYVSNLLSNHYPFIIAGIVFLVALWKILRSTPKGNELITEFFTEMPVLGEVLKQVQIALFARILGTLLRCGVPILTSLQAVEKALSNVIYKKAMVEIREAVSRGESLSQSIGKHRKLFPESIILMTDVGERSGNIGDMLEKAGNIFERDMEMALETAVTLIQPALVVFLAIFIVIIAMAMYLPLFDIVKVVG